MIVSFIGHAKVNYTQKHADTLLEILEDNIKGKDVTFYMGLNGRFDWLAKNCCLEYKKKHSNAKVVFVTPYMDEEYLRNLRFAIEGFDEVLYPDLEKVPKRYAIVARNQYMIKDSDLVIGYIIYCSGNAINGWDYAAIKNKYRINLNDYM